jgi:hypothetical protein
MIIARFNGHTKEPTDISTSVSYPVFYLYVWFHAFHIICKYQSGHSIKARKKLVFVGEFLYTTLTSVEG